MTSGTRAASAQVESANVNPAKAGIQGVIGRYRSLLPRAQLREAGNDSRRVVALWIPAFARMTERFHLIDNRTKLRTLRNGPTSP